MNLSAFARTLLFAFEILTTFHQAFLAIKTEAIDDVAHEIVHLNAETLRSFLLDACAWEHVQNEAIAFLDHFHHTIMHSHLLDRLLQAQRRKRFLYLHISKFAAIEGS